MPGTGPELEIQGEDDIVLVRREVRSRAKELSFGLVDQTKLVTAASELARNTLIHGGGGTCQMDVVRRNGQVGLQLTFRDEGPGLNDVEEALRDGYTTGGGLGLGLGGTKRLVHHFEIHSQPGKGTRVVIVRWK